MTLPFIRVVFVSIMHEWVLKSEWYSFFLSVWPHNAKSIKLKEIGKALDDGGPSDKKKEYVTLFCFSYIFHPPIMRLPYMKVVFVSIMHQLVLKSKLYSFFLWVWLDKAKSRKRKEKSKEGDDGGPLQQRKRSICTDSPCTDSALQGPSLRSPTTPSKVLGLTWQCDIWLHVAYGV